MHRPGPVIAFVAGAASGLLCGWLILGIHAGFPGTAPQPASPSVSAAKFSRPRPNDSPQRVPLVTEQPSLAGAQADEVQRLRARVAELEKQLASETKSVTAREVSPVKPPERLDPRFESERIRLALDAAIKAVGLEGEVNAIDCDEYPCLAIGEMKGASFGPEESAKVADALAKAGYAGDSMPGFGARVEDHGQPRNLFGVAIFPKTEGDEMQQISKRLHYRFYESQGLE